MCDYEKLILIGHKWLNLKSMTCQYPIGVD